MKYLVLPALAAFLACIPASPMARTKLVTLPERELLITSLENIAQPLLSEERILPLQAGTNYIDFSWQNVSIRPESVDLHILDADDVNIIATGYPTGQNSLTWEVYSPRDEARRVRVVYLLNGIRQVTSYELRLGTSETEGEFRQYILISNQSGEDLEDAVIRAPFLGEVSRSLRNGESRRILAHSVPQLPVDKLYISRPLWLHHAGEDGETIAMVYELENSAAVGLGMGRIPGGKIRVFSQPPGESPVFLGEDNLPATAPGESAEARLGVVRDVVLERSMVRDERSNRRENNNRWTVLSDREIQLRYRLKNFKDEPVTLRIHEQPASGDWEAASSRQDGVRITRKSVNELVIEVDLPAASGEEPAEITMDMTFSYRNVFPNE